MKIFCKIDGVNIPLISTGSSPFIGAGQFGTIASTWRKKFLNNTMAILEILEAGYSVGARGIQVIPIGKILDAALIMIEKYPDYVITGSTLPGQNSGIEALIEANAKIIFIHGNISDKKGPKLIELLDLVSDHGIIPGIATHHPISTIKHAIENDLNVKTFLVPFNEMGYLMGNSSKLEELVDNTKRYSFIGMKVLAAGKIEPKQAFNYIKKHNIEAVTIGMTTQKEAKMTTEIALANFQ